MHFLALFADRAAAARARARLVESGTRPEDISVVDRRSDDFVTHDDVIGADLNFWAHVNSMLGSARQISALNRQLRRGACVVGVHTACRRRQEIFATLTAAGARKVWQRVGKGEAVVRGVSGRASAISRMP